MIKLAKRSLGFSQFNEANRKRRASWRKQDQIRAQKKLRTQRDLATRNALAGNLFSAKVSATQQLTNLTLRNVSKGPLGAVVNRIV